MSFKRYPSMTESGVEWLGDIPSHWAVSKFRHAFIESAEKIESDVFGVMLSVSGYRGIEVKEYDDANRRRLDEEVIGYRIVRPGQLVVNTMWLNYAGLGVSDYEGHVSPAYRAYWITEGLDRRFVHHMMRSELFVRGYTKFLTGVRPNSLQMGRDDLMGFQLLKPPQEEQRAIAAFLDRETAKIDALVEEQKRLIELLKEKRQAVISQAVTKGLDPSVPMKDSGVAWIGAIPSHWSLLPLCRVAARPGALFIDGDWIESKNLSDEGIRYLTTGNVGEGEYKEQGYGFITDATFAELRCTEVRQGDILISRLNQPIGRACVVPVLGGRVVTSVDNVIVRPDADFDARYLVFMLSSKAHFANMDGLARGTTMQRISRSVLGRVRFALPPLAEQTRIADFLLEECSAIDELAGEAHRGVDLLQERRSALISAAVTGKIDVRGLAQQPEVKAA